MVHGYIENIMLEVLRNKTCLESNVKHDVKSNVKNAVKSSVKPAVQSYMKQNVECNVKKVCRKLI